MLLAGEFSRAIWASVRDATPFAASGPLGQWPVWRIICPPSDGPALGQLLTRETGGTAIGEARQFITELLRVT